MRALEQGYLEPRLEPVAEVVYRPNPALYDWVPTWEDDDDEDERETAH